MMDITDFQTSKKYVDEGLRNLSIKPSPLPTQDIYQCNTINNHETVTKSKNEYDNCNEYNDCNEIEMKPNFLIKGGKYGRKVDFLIDNLIRKTRRTTEAQKYNDFDSQIPHTIGPEPTTDHILSLYIPTDMKVSNNSLTPIITTNSSNSSMFHSGQAGISFRRSILDQGNNEMKSNVRNPPEIRVWIDKSHGDWEIEEVESNLNGCNSNVSMDDMDEMIVDEVDGHISSDSDDDPGIVIP
jgi:hypothetical protein